MANMADVAKKAGVGVSTVSKVINNYDHVSLKTRNKVLAAIKELNYVPNAIASSLSTKNGRRLGLVIFINNQRQAIDEINMQYIFGAFKEARKYNLDVVTIFSTVLKDKNADELNNYFKSLNINSLVIYGLHKEEAEFEKFIKMETLSTVVVDAPFNGKKTTSVMIDHKKAQYEITNKMLESHCNISNILYLAGRRNGFVTDLRLSGVIDAAKEANVNLNIQYADFSESKAKELTKIHAHSANIIVCASDLMAIGAVSALNELDIFRPVCGFDGITLLGYIKYEIMTVKQDFFRLSKRAISEVVNLIDGEEGKAIKLDYEIGHIMYEDVIM